MGQGHQNGLKDLILQSLENDKAQDIQLIALEEQTGLADYMIIATGTSSTQTKSLADKLRERLNIAGVKEIVVEGASQGDWVVLDAGDIIVHIFRPEVREFYNIENMWMMGAAPSSPHQGLSA